MPAGRLRGALLPAVVVAIIGVGVALVLGTSGDRHAGDYQRYVRQYVGGWSSSADPGGPQRDKVWVLSHPDQVLAEGDRACAWLLLRPDASDIDPTGRSTVDALAGLFVQAEHARNPRLSTFGHATITAGAWAYLCSSVREDKTAPRSRDED